jgi:hypothetical protein
MTSDKRVAQRRKTNEILTQPDRRTATADRRDGGRHLTSTNPDAAHPDNQPVHRGPQFDNGPHVATENPPEGHRDPEIPVSEGNKHLVIGDTQTETDERVEKAAIAEENLPAITSAVMRAVNRMKVGTFTLAQIAAAEADEGGIPTGSGGGPDAQTGLPRPRSDVAANPTEASTPAFQGFDGSADPTARNPADPSGPSGQARSFGDSAVDRRFETLPRRVNTAPFDPSQERRGVGPVDRRAHDPALDPRQ